MNREMINEVQERNRLYTEWKDAKSQLDQAKRNLQSGIISEDEFMLTQDMCYKVIHAYEK